MTSIRGHRPEFIEPAVGRQLIIGSGVATAPRFVMVQRRLMLPVPELDDSHIVTRVHNAATLCPDFARHAHSDEFVSAPAVEAYLERSARYLAERRFADAAAAACHAIALAPFDLRARRALALARAARAAQSEAITRVRHPADRGAADPQVLAARGKALMRDGNLDAAEAMLRTAIRRAPAEERFCVMLAEVLNAQGAVEKAVGVLRELTAIPTRDPHVYARLGDILTQSGKLDEAEVAVRTAVDMAPAVEGFRSLLAEVLHRQGRNTEAFAILQDLVARRTRDPHTHARYGRVLVQLGDLAGAAAAMRTATVLQPDGDGFHNALADVLNRQGERAEALAILRHLVARPTPQPHIHAHLGHLLAQDGDLVAAEAAFGRAAALDPGVDGFRVAQADVVHRQGRHAEAVALLQDLVARPTRDPQIHARYGKLLVQVGNLAGAEAAIRTAINIDPSVDSFQNALADVLNRQGERTAALEILRHLIGKPTRDAHIHAHLGHVLAQDGDLVGAGAAFCRAAELDPSVDDFRAAQADVLDRQGWHDTALAILRDLAGKPTRDPHIHARLGHGLVRMGDLAGAESAFRAAVALAPEVEAFRRGLADVLAQRGQHSEAVGILRNLADAEAPLEKAKAPLAPREPAVVPAECGEPNRKSVPGAVPPAWRLLRLALGPVPAKPVT